MKNWECVAIGEGLIKVEKEDVGWIRENYNLYRAFRLCCPHCDRCFLYPILPGRKEKAKRELAKHLVEEHGYDPPPYMRYERRKKGVK